MTNKQSYTETILVTPEMAKDWLEKYNKRNRKPSPMYVSIIAREIREGRWIETNATIGFDTEGFISDGQTRLAAIVLSGIPVRLHVVRNTEPYNGLVRQSRSRSSMDNFVALRIECDSRTSSAHKAFGKFLQNTSTRIPDRDVVELHEFFGDKMSSSCKKCNKYCHDGGVGYSANFSVVHFILSTFYLESKVDSLFEKILARHGEVSKRHSAYTTKLVSGKFVEEKEKREKLLRQNKISVKRFFTDMVQFIDPKFDETFDSIIEHYMKVINNE